MHKNIERFSPSLLSATELITFASRFDTIISNHIRKDEFLHQQLKLMKDAVIRLEVAIQSARTNDFSIEIKQKDDARNIAFRSLFSFLNGMSGFLLKPDFPHAAHYLLAIIQHQEKRVDRLSYTKKSGALSAILVNFDKTEAQRYIHRLGAADIVQQLTDAQKVFEATYQKKIKNDVKQTSMKTAQEESLEIRYNLSSIIHYIDAQMQNNIMFKPIVAEVNNVISEIMTMVQKRKTRNKSSGISPRKIKDFQTRAA